MGEHTHTHTHTACLDVAGLGLAGVAFTLSALLAGPGAGLGAAVASARSAKKKCIAVSADLCVLVISGHALTLPAVVCLLPPYRNSSPSLSYPLNTLSHLPFPLSLPFLPFSASLTIAPSLLAQQTYTCIVLHTRTRAKT